jgi:hypothetical protein
MIRREPHLASNYQGAWPVPTIIAVRLKYWARQKKVEAATATPPQEKDTGKRKRKRNERAAAEPGSSRRTRSRPETEHPVDVVCHDHRLQAGSSLTRFTPDLRFVVATFRITH